MSEIPDIQIKGINIPDIQSGIYIHPSFNSPDIPVAVPIGFPIIEMPCVEVRKANYENEALISNDPEQNVAYCDGGAQIPSYTPINFVPEEIVPIEESQPQRHTSPETPPTEEPPPTPAKKTDCPPVGAEQIGTKVADGKGSKEITGYELIGNRCVTQYSEVSFAEQIVDAVPSIPQVVQVGGIAIIATSSAAATPILLRAVKPIVKQIMTRIQKLLGKNPTKPTQSEIRTNAYRKKKDLPPLKKRKNKVK